MSIIDYQKKSQVGYFPKFIFLILLLVVVTIIVFKTQDWFFKIEKLTFEKYADVEATDLANAISASKYCLAYQENTSSAKMVDVFLLDQYNQTSLTCARSFLRTNGIRITLDSCKGYEFPKVFYQRCNDNSQIEEESELGIKSVKLKCTKQGLLEFEEGCPAPYTQWDEDKKECKEVSGQPPLDPQIFYQSDKSILPDQTDATYCQDNSFCVQEGQCYANEREFCDKTENFRTVCENGVWTTKSPPCTSQDRIVNDAIWEDYYGCKEGRCLSRFISCGCGCVNPIPWLNALKENSDACESDDVCTDVLSACIPEQTAIEIDGQTYTCLRGDWQGLECSGKEQNSVCNPTQSQSQISPRTWGFNEELNTNPDYKFDYLISRTNPVLVKFPTFTASAVLKIDIAFGELEKIKELLDRTCFTGQSQKTKISVSKKILAEEKEIKMLINSQEVEKRKLDCESNFEIEAGNYYIKTKKEGNEVKLIT